MLNTHWGNGVLTDFDARGNGGMGIRLAPSKGKWIVTFKGEQLGTIQRTCRKGVVRWAVDGSFGAKVDDVSQLAPNAYRGAEFREAVRLLEEYLLENATT
jgi:hypothetical protein